MVTTRGMGAPESEPPCRLRPPFPISPSGLPVVSGQENKVSRQNGRGSRRVVIPAFPPALPCASPRGVRDPVVGRGAAHLSTRGTLGNAPPSSLHPCPRL